MRPNRWDLRFLPKDLKSYQVLSTIDCRRLSSWNSTKTLDDQTELIKLTIQSFLTMNACLLETMTVFRHGQIKLSRNRKTSCEAALASLKGWSCFWWSNWLFWGQTDLWWQYGCGVYWIAKQYRGRTYRESGKAIGIRYSSDRTSDERFERNRGALESLR